MEHKILLLIFSIFISNNLLGYDLKSLKFIGEADMTWFLFDVYHARLYTEGQKDLFSKTVLLELAYKRDLKGVDIADRSATEMIHIGADKKFAESYRKTMENIFPDVDDKTILGAYFYPDGGITFYRNRKEKIGFVRDDTFAKYFLGIWLDEKTSEPDVRKQLLGIK